MSESSWSHGAVEPWLVQRRPVCPSIEKGPFGMKSVIEAVVHYALSHRKVIGCVFGDGKEGVTDPTNSSQTYATRWAVVIKEIG